MRPDLLEILRCPVCKGELGLTVVAKDGDEIVRGTLVCAKCRVDYPIDDGIPDLLPPDERDEGAREGLTPPAPRSRSRG